MQGVMQFFKEVILITNLDNYNSYKYISTCFVIITNDLRNKNEKFIFSKQSQPPSPTPLQNQPI